MLNLKVVFFIAILLGSVLPTYSQSKEKTKQDAFADVSENMRKNLVERLNLFIEYQIAKDWNRAYGLLGEQYKQSIGGGLSRERYLEKPSHLILKRFTPKAAYLLLGTAEDGWWMIEGCGEFKGSGKLKSQIEAYRQNGEWFFSDVGVQ
ncbi:MAG: hypothetical protein JWP66_2013, partial [Naasia sp.]|nr:hypothetical protein [Naasia sp.]